MVSERSVRSGITQYLTRKGIPWFPIPASVYGRRGAPDLVACLMGGRFMGIEVKAPNGKSSKLQLHWKRKIEQKGGVYLIARSVNDVRKVVEGD